MAKPRKGGTPQKPARSRNSRASSESRARNARSTGTRPAARQSFPVVGMGASAGGLEAFQKFFAAMPPDAGMAFVLAQHLDPRHVTLMPELLGHSTAMPVAQVRDETPVQADHVYVIPPNATLTIEAGMLRVRPPRDDRGLRMPIDSLFHSLAEDQGRNAVCVLFSGSGSDGSLGLRAVKDHGGMVMAQSPESAKHDAILRSAIATGMVDHVLRPEEMPAKLLEYAAYLREHGEGSAARMEETAQQLTRICAVLRRRTGHDFSQYKTNTLVRRIERRMQVLQVPSVVGYVARLRNDPKEADLLFRDLLIGVTHFFRDPAAFEVLARDVIPRIVDHAGADGAIRVWTPGCATGEEAYSVAILLKEEMNRKDVRPRVQIFAGDIDDEALDMARAGRYPEGVAQHITPERLDRFFVKSKHSYQVAKEVRELCLFSTHNLIKDPPFSRLDLIVCRNLLIYLEANIQQHVSTLFHYSLRPGGYLFLGPAENVAGPADLFSAIDKKHKIYQRNETVARPPLVFAPTERSQPRGKPWSPRVPTPSHTEMVSGLERLLLDRYAPAWIVINAQAEAVYFSPRTGKFLEPAPGIPSMDVVNMARPGLRLDLRTSIHKALKTNEEVVREGVDVATNGETQRINLIVRPIPETGPEAALYLVVFQEVGGPRGKDASAGGPEDSGEDGEVVKQLESELRMTKEHLQATVEEVETSNEELKSSNEELLSTNEELQSANEELQTSKEELQSVNEELETINTELSKKVDELDTANSDLQNLLQSTQIPTLFLDNDLRIKRFTEAATRLFRLIDSDVGRPISDLASRFDGDLVADLKEVLRTLAPREKQLTLASGGETFFLRILPYRRVDNVIDGLVVTYTDVTQINQAVEMQARLAAILASSQDAIVGRDLEGTITAWNRAATHMFGYTADEAIGQPISLIASPQQPDEMGRVVSHARQGEPVAPFESLRLTKDGRELVVSVAISPVWDFNGRLVGESAIFRDITDLKRAHRALEEEARRKDEFLAILGHELRNPLAPLRNATEILRTPGAGEAKARAALGIIDRQLTHVTSLVDQLLDASRISSGKIQLHAEEVDLAAVVRMAVDDQRALVDTSGLDLEVKLPDEPLRVSGDPVRLAQVVSNLLANAVKFTDPGGRVTVHLRGDARRSAAVLSVKDTGIGIEADALKRLFTPFTQVSRSLDRTRGGLGLGLALVRGLVQSHGGTVEAHSEGRGRGAEFVVRLPLAGARSRAGTEHRPPVKDGTPQRVLIVEDNLDSAETLRTLLELAGHTVEIANDGRAALAAAKAFKPQAVLCDIGLPGEMDGYALAAALKDGPDGPDAARPYLIALTGYGQAADRDRARAAGFDQHLTKPADPSVIRQILANLGGNRKLKARP
jgi:two-component system, chemotaxis family, CheB/CheR fusion protein